MLVAFTGPGRSTEISRGLHEHDQVGPNSSEITAGGFVIGVTPSFAQDADLLIANRYFVQRKQSKQSLMNQARGSEVMRRLRPRGYTVGSQWEVHLQLKRLDSDASGSSTSRGLTLKYTVLEWSGYPDAQLVLRIQDDSQAGPDLYLEQRLYFSEGLSWIRRCRTSGNCGAWAPITAETLRLGGEDQGLGWEHGPVAFDVRTLESARFRDGLATWTSEDFFGRKSSWKWREGEPWPEAIESAQGSGVLIASRGAQ